MGSASRPGPARAVAGFGFPSAAGARRRRTSPGSRPSRETPPWAISSPAPTSWSAFCRLRRRREVSSIAVCSTVCRTAPPGECRPRRPRRRGRPPRCARRRPLGGAILDVLAAEPAPADHPLLSHPRVMVTPHVASATQPAGAARQVIQGVRAHLPASRSPMRSIADRATTHAPRRRTVSGTSVGAVDPRSRPSSPRRSPRPVLTGEPATLDSRSPTGRRRTGCPAEPPQRRASKGQGNPRCFRFREVEIGFGVRRFPGDRLFDKFI